MFVIINIDKFRISDHWDCMLHQKSPIILLSYFNYRKSCFELGFAANAFTFYQLNRIQRKFIKNKITSLELIKGVLFKKL